MIKYGGMEVKLGRMVTYDDLLLPTQLCDLLIFWLREIQKVENFKGNS